MNLNRCGHGARLDLPLTAREQEQNAFLRDLVPIREQASINNVLHYARVLREFCKKHEHLIDDDLIRRLLSMGCVAILADETERAEFVAGTVISLQMGTPQGRLTIPPQDFSSSEILEVRDMVKFVADRIPCQCLEETVRLALSKLPCGCCGTMKLDRKLFICSRCKFERYCSVACQRKHWKEHKTMCRYARDRGSQSH